MAEQRERPNWKTQVVSFERFITASARLTVQTSKVTTSRGTERYHVALEVAKAIDRKENTAFGKGTLPIFAKYDPTSGIMRKNAKAVYLMEGEEAVFKNLVGVARDVFIRENDANGYKKLAKLLYSSPVFKDRFFWKQDEGKNVTEYGLRFDRGGNGNNLYVRFLPPSEQRPTIGFSVTIYPVRSSQEEQVESYSVVLRSPVEVLRFFDAFEEMHRFKTNVRALKFLVREAKVETERPKNEIDRASYEKLEEKEKIFLLEPAEEVSFSDVEERVSTDPEVESEISSLPVLSSEVEGEPTSTEAELTFTDPFSTPTTGKVDFDFGRTERVGKGERRSASTPFAPASVKKPYAKDAYQKGSEGLEEKPFQKRPDQQRRQGWNDWKGFKRTK